MMKMIVHPSLIRSIKDWESPTQILIQMEFCSGGDLDAFLEIEKRRGRKLEEEQIWKFFIQICLGIQYLHKNEILHHDLKPKNAFLTEDLSLKIGDVGESTSLDAILAMKESTHGTVYYMSPEMINSEK